MINKTTVIFTLKEPIDKVPGLFKLTTDEGMDFSTFNENQYPLGEAIEISYEVVKSGSKGQYQQNRLIDKPASKAVVEKFKASAAQINSPMEKPRTWNPPANEPAVKSQLDRIEEMLKEIHGQIINPL